MITGLLASASESGAREGRGDARATADDARLLARGAVGEDRAALRPLCACALRSRSSRSRLLFGAAVPRRICSCSARSRRSTSSPRSRSGSSSRPSSAPSSRSVLISIFTALPLVMLSGAFAPIESMPPFWQTLSRWSTPAPLHHDRARHPPQGRRTRRDLAERAGLARVRSRRDRGSARRATARSSTDVLGQRREIDVGRVRGRRAGRRVGRAQQPRGLQSRPRAQRRARPRRRRETASRSGWNPVSARDRRVRGGFALRRRLVVSK